jgi:hypothetical protein
MKTAMAALEVAKNGEWREAWEIAQQDEGLAEGTQFEQWQEWAIKAIERRQLIESSVMPAAHYS